METVVPFDDYFEIENILTKLKEKYNKVLYKDKESYQVKIAKRKYKTEYKIEDRTHAFKYKKIAEDMIDIDVGVRLSNGYKHYHIYLYQDEIYVLTKFDYQFVSKIIDKLVEPYSNFKILKLEELLYGILNERLENILSESECIACNNKIKISVGEVRFYIDKGLFLPKRCKSCRNKRKQIKQED